ncbi:hypothetical protein GCM10008920_02480 [Pediococcus acidilactici]|uniref:Uncharacterized protein n=1 Tax=Pediococcus acidilactici DSM 20284 TaxID=862514 RepID=E0NDN1_PEDAC|nr:hypothetical protein HMPREF0623_0403 [Pediococcus acidilactici DSM 20284]GHC31371.1 hypothetical protein GCM10008920_02480 [Pediococcus acidilactici]
MMSNWIKILKSYFGEGETKVSLFRALFYLIKLGTTGIHPLKSRRKCDQPGQNDMIGYVIK